MKTKRINFLTFALFAPLALSAQVTVSANHVADAYERPIATAKLCFAPVDAATEPTGFRVGSIQEVLGEVCSLVSNGVMESGHSVAPSTAGVYYHIYAKDRTTGAVIRDYGMTPITGSNWNLDTYNPRSTTMAAPQGASSIAGKSQEGAGSSPLADKPGQVASPSAPLMGGVKYASESQTRNGSNDGIANAMRTGQTVVADPAYTLAEKPFVWPSKFPTASSSHYIEQRNGMHLDLYNNSPISQFTDMNDGHDSVCVNTIGQGYPVGAAEWTGTKNLCNVTYFWSGAPGINYGTNPGNSGQHGPGGWSLSSAHSVTSVINSRGISNMSGGVQYKAGIGDAVGMYLYHNSYGGSIAGSDEGNTIWTGFGGESGTTYVGSIKTGGAGATTVKVNCTADCNYPGDGRYLVDWTGAIMGYATANQTPVGSFTPGWFTVAGLSSAITASTAWGTLAADVKTPTSPAGTLLGVGATSITFTVNPATLNSVASPGPFAVGDLICFGGMFHEQAIVKSVTGTGPWTITVPLRMPHEAKSWVFANGACGTAIDFTANDITASQVLHYPVDVIGSLNSGTLVYRYFQSLNAAGYWPGNVNFPVAAGAITNTGGVVTFNSPNLSSAQYYGQANLTISGASLPDFNGMCTASFASTSGALSCNQAASTGKGPATGATLSIGTSGHGTTDFKLVRMAEVLDVLDYDQAGCGSTKTAPCLDGTFTVEPNNAAWAVNDSVENVHHYSAQMKATRTSFGEYNPLQSTSSSAEVLSLWGSGIQGGNPSIWSHNWAAKLISNGNPASIYAYHGGALVPPGGYALGGNAPFNYGLAMQYAPDPSDSSLFWIGCPISGCDDTGFFYNLFYLKGKGAAGSIKYSPYNQALAFAFAGGLDLNDAPLVHPTFKSSLNGQVAYFHMTSVDNGGAFHTWTVNAPATGGGYTNTLPQKSGTFAMTSDIPAAMVASGARHAGGLVPDPGSSTGTTRFLREDGLWQVPACSGVTGGADAKNTRTGNGGSPGGYPSVVAHKMLTGLTAGMNPVVTYTPAADGMFRITSYLYITAACKSGNVAHTVHAIPMPGHPLTAATATPDCATSFVGSSQTVTVHQAAGQAITGYTGFNSVIGSPVYNVDMTIEQLQ
ncbi:MAG TPA: hypothetical protein VGG85_03415 [Terracidiphilus sp.]|jgi:hypothetical protein